MATKRSVYKVGLLIALLAGIIVSGMLLLSEDDGEKSIVASQNSDRMDDPRKEKSNRRADQLRARSKRFKSLMAARQRVSKLRELPDPPPIVRPAFEEAEPEIDDPVPLDARQRRELRAALDSLYDPAELSRAILEGKAADSVKEIGEAYRELTEAERLGDMPMDDELSHVVDRMGVVKDYAMNVLHAQRLPGSDRGKLQQELVKSINNGFRGRLQDLTEDYPFLEIEMVDLSE